MTNSKEVTGKTQDMKRKPLDVLKTILSCADTASSSSCDDSSAAAQQTTTSTSTSTSLPTPKALTFQKPSEEEISAYDLETVKAIRGNNLDLLRQLWRSGKSMDACNQFGESILHMACRRGYVKVVEFLLLEVKVRTDRCDDFGRNPFHDALWTPTPNFDVMNLLIDYANPSLLLTEDVRGNTPFAYARKDHSEQWISFLEKRGETLVDRIRGGGSAVVATTTTTGKAVIEPMVVEVVG